jgi:hypothetical protein
MKKIHLQYDRAQHRQPIQRNRHSRHVRLRSGGPGGETLNHRRAAPDGAQRASSGLFAVAFLF